MKTIIIKPTKTRVVRMLFFISIFFFFGLGMMFFPSERSILHFFQPVVGCVAVILSMGSALYLALSAGKPIITITKTHLIYHKKNLIISRKSIVSVEKRLVSEIMNTKVRWIDVVTSENILTDELITLDFSLASMDDFERAYEELSSIREVG